MMPIPNRLDGRAPRCACRRLARANTRSPRKPRLGFFQRKIRQGGVERLDVAACALRSPRKTSGNLTAPERWLAAPGIEEFQIFFDVRFWFGFLSFSIGSRFTQSRLPK
jgi:hypothetical protein